MTKEDHVQLADILYGFITRPFSAEIVNTQFSRHWDSIQSNESVYSSFSKGHQDFYLFFKELFGVLPANPSKIFRKELFESLYQRDAFIGTSYSNLSQQLQFFVENKRFVSVVGLRGSGKTSFINTWLHENTHTFLDVVQRLIWFRVDASKLYNMQFYEVENYFKIHAVYVFIVYSCDDIDPDATPNSTFQKLLQSGHLKNGAYKRLKSFIKARWRRSLNRFHSDDTSVHVVREMCSSHEFSQLAREYYSALERVFRKNGFKIVAIVDGADNLSASKDDKRYIEMCKAIRSFFMSIREDTIYKILLLTRPETINALEIGVIGHNYIAANDALPLVFEQLSIPRVSIEAVVRKKVSGMLSDAAKPRRESLLSALREHGLDDGEIDNILDEKRINASIDGFFAGTNRAINDALAPVPDHHFFVSRSRKIDLLDDLFAGDIRSFFRAMRQSVNLRTYYISKNIPNAFGAALQLEIFLLGGAFYKITRHLSGADNARRNAVDMPQFRARAESEPEWAPNIFWYSTALAAADAARRWHGLSGLRVLQMLSQFKMTRRDLVDVLKSLFGYSERVLGEQIESFQAFGLIRAEATVGVVGITGVQQEFETVYSTTNKGRLISTLSLYYLKWQYFLALDTPMYSGYMWGYRGETFVKQYRALDDRRSTSWNFFDASISTCATFLKHVYNGHKAEALMVEDKKNQEKINAVFGDVARCREVFDIPKSFWEITRKNTTEILAMRCRQKPNADGRFLEFVGHLKGNFSVH